MHCHQYRQSAQFKPRAQPSYNVTIIHRKRHKASWILNRYVTSQLNSIEQHSACLKIWFCKAQIIFTKYKTNLKSKAVVQLTQQSLPPQEDQRFESKHWQVLFNQLYIEVKKAKKWMGHFVNLNRWRSVWIFNSEICIQLDERFYKFAVFLSHIWIHFSWARLINRTHNSHLATQQLLQKLIWKSISKQFKS